MLCGYLLPRRQGAVCPKSPHTCSSGILPTQQSVAPPGLWEQPLPPQVTQSTGQHVPPLGFSIPP